MVELYFKYQLWFSLVITQFPPCHTFFKGYAFTKKIFCHFNLMITYK